MFICFKKQLPTIKVEKKKRKHEAKEEVEKHLHISILDPLETNFHTLDKFYKLKKKKNLYYQWI
jgi:hypothetical protein